jgi:hypothetical protein
MDIIAKISVYPLRAKLLLTTFFTGLFLLNCTGPGNNMDLEAGFINPPDDARPRVWWHWMNGNITKDGIRADLEWMHRIGIGGFQNFDASLATPQIVEKRLIYMTPEWKDAFSFTTRLADSLGLEMAIAGSPGWSESGGPWVTPAQAMKKLVWSEIWIEGGKPFTGILPHPPSTTGLFQNIGESGGFSAAVSPGREIPEFYADAAVVAFRLPDDDRSLFELNPRVTSSGGSFELATLANGDLTDFSFLPAGKNNEKAWIQFDFQHPVSIGSLSMVKRETGIRFPGFSGGAQVKRAVEISDDGKTFRQIFELPAGGTSQNTYNFTPATARYFRITFLIPPPPQTDQGLASMFGINTSGSRPPERGINIAELMLYQVPRINRFEDKAGFTSAAGIYDMATPPVPENHAVRKENIINLTSLMAGDGTLNWTPPEGRWAILRLGYSLTGHRNSPASPEATGLEVDKLNAGHVTSYFENYLDQYKDATGGLMGKKGLRYIITDSWEAGVQNWTDSMISEFAVRRGYDIIPWMPALTGHIVESAEASDRFLWDFRKTIGELTAQNHYDQLTKILKERDMGRYTESHESGRAFIGDGMEVKRSADIPMSATWTPGGFAGSESEGVATRFKADVRESASVAHLYGQNIAAAESMTAIGNTWAFSPERLKPTADMELAMGLNRFVIHTSVHQPVNDKIPGLGLGPFGQWFTRHETWAEMARPWTTYLARSSYMLQQGKFVADIIYYYGEDNNITALFGDKLPDIPEGYNYDFVNSDALLNLLTVKNGKIVSPSGMAYSLIVLDSNSVYMPLPVLKKLSNLAQDGAMILGPKPVTSPGNNDDPAEFKELTARLWPAENGKTAAGKGVIYTGMELSDVLKELNIEPDFEYNKPLADTRMLSVHRQLPGTDIYWVNNRNHRSEKINAVFRVSGKEAEIWHPETGLIEPASFEMSDGRTTVPLDLVPDDAVFVVFRKRTSQSSRTIPRPSESLLSEISGQWLLSFQPDRGAPEKISFDSLSSWSTNDDPGIRYFSGTCTYSKKINVDDEWKDNGGHIVIDLGDVKNLAEVILNGKSLGILWKTPFRTEITNELKPGSNDLEIKVTNLWVNRLIGDQQPGNGKKYTYTTQAFYRADSPLLPSGLLGPVKIFSITDNKDK